MGLGIDVTYRGLLSESYTDKFHALLGSIKNGYKTKIKYFKNHITKYKISKFVNYYCRGKISIFFCLIY